MPLRSTTLKGSAALQACLVNDRAHVTQGAVGAHVGLIQKCLLVLEPSVISADEIRSRTYGRTTAASVLAYKKPRDIVNRSYQSQADNIVGKMTIARLDEDIAKVEQARTLFARCPQGGGVGPLAVRSFAAGSVGVAPELLRPSFAGLSSFTCSAPRSSPRASSSSRSNCSRGLARSCARSE